MTGPEKTSFVTRLAKVWQLCNDFSPAIVVGLLVVFAVWMIAKPNPSQSDVEPTAKLVPIFELRANYIDRCYRIFWNRWLEEGLVEGCKKMADQVYPPALVEADLRLYIHERLSGGE